MAGGAVAISVRRARQKIIRHFTLAKATAPDRAVPYDSDAEGWLHRRLRRRVFERMRAFGLVKEPRPGLFYLDEDEIDAFRWNMRKRAIGIMALVGAAAAAVIALG